MPRLIRLLEKKRGDRRTGSNLVGSVSEAVFCGTLFLLGVTSLSVLVGVHVWQPDRAWYTIGLGFWLMVAVLSSFVVVGGIGLIWTALRLGISAERRSALATHAGNMDLIHEAVPQSRDYPTLPVHAGLTNSPGIELAYRLPSAQSPGWRLLAKTIFALLWNGIACVLIVIAAKGWLDGAPEWFLTAFLVPYLAVSGCSIYYLGSQIWLQTGMGPTTLEIADHPLKPGQEYQVHLSQAGHINVKSLELWLVCEEEATYHQGTDIRHELRTVFRQRLYAAADLQIEPGMPFQTDCLVPVPATAMHSFQSEHNAVHWKLVVECIPKHWPQFERPFPIVVYPGEATVRTDAASPAVRPSQRAERSAAAAGPGVVA